MDERDELYLRAAFAAARHAVERGNMPFGSVLVDEHGDIVLEGQNTAITEHNPTSHAEANLMREAAGRFEPDYLARCTMYASAEPCAMCAGTVYWAGVRRVVYGLDVLTLDEIIGADPLNPTPHLRAEVVLNGGKYPIAIDGPALVEEARAIHEGFWDAAPAPGSG